MDLVRHVLETPRHRTCWIEEGPLVIFVHGWPELGLVWRSQVEHFAAAGWRCVAPDMRGYGGSGVPDAASAYTVRELTADLVELHDALGGRPAVWIGHDWGSAIVWSMASHHAERCRGVVNLCIPYFARGLALPTLIPLIDRTLYPVERYPFGQWDYWLFYREHFVEAARELEADVAATFATLYRRTPAGAAGGPSPSADTRAQGGRFGKAGRAPSPTRDGSMLQQRDFEAIVAAFRETGFAGANAWYMNDAANLAYALEAPAFGVLRMPVLFLHAAHDINCKTLDSRLADPMREDCTDLTEITIDAGHESMLEQPNDVNAAIADWVRKRVSG